MRFRDHDVTRSSVNARARAGIGRTFQRLEAFGSLTVRENVLVAREIKGGVRGWFGRRPDAIVDGLLERVGITQYAHQRADSVPTGVARLLEIARALAIEPRLLLLDEPSSGLDEAETENFGALLRELAARGTAILMVEHDMDLVMGVCDLIHVLEFGRVIATGHRRTDPLRPRGAGRLPRLRRRPGAGADRRHPSHPGGAVMREAPILELIDVHAAYGRIEVLRGVDLSMPRGAVVALLGANGAGKTTLLKVISGLMPATSGDIHLAGTHVLGASPDELTRAGLCMVPEGRGVFPNLTVEENLWLASYAGVPVETHPHRGVRAVPAPEGAPPPAGGQPVRRRAADALARARARHQARAAAAGRAVDGARAADRRGALRVGDRDRRSRACRSSSSSSSRAPRSALPTTPP